MIRILTAHLTGMLADLSHTAAKAGDSGVVAGVVLHSTDGHLGDAPGRTTLLVGTSTTGRIVGHTYTHCTGQLPPMLWPITEVAAVRAVCAPLVKANKDHAIQISRTGDEITVAEDPDLFGQRTRLTFKTADLDEYPASVWQLLADIRTVPAARRPDGSAVPIAQRTDIGQDDLAPFLRVARHRGCVLQLYRYHQHLPIHVQIGPHYRGLLKPDLWEGDESDAGRFPPGDVYPLELAAGT